MASNPNSTQVSEFFTNFSSLTDFELGNLRTRTEQALALNEQEVETLKIQRTKFLNSFESLENLPIQTSIMLPLTGSVYVLGEVTPTEHVLIDVGAGCFIRQDIESAMNFFKKRLHYVNAVLSTLQEMIKKKSIYKCIIYKAIENRLNETIAAMNDAADDAASANEAAVARAAAIINAAADSTQDSLTPSLTSTGIDSTSGCPSLDNLNISA